MLEISAGGIVVDGDQVLLIRDRFGRWTFPKGHLEDGETERQAARREVEEETGVHAGTRARLGRIRYTLPNGNEKQVTFYLMQFQGGELKPLKEELDEALWVDFDEAAKLLRRGGYPGYAVLLRRASELNRRARHKSSEVEQK